MRQNLVTLLVVVAAIVAAAEVVRVKHSAALLTDRKPTHINGVPITVEQQNEIIEKLKTRIGLLQAVLNQHGLSGEQPVPDDGLQIPGVYPQLVYDKTIQ